MAKKKMVKRKGVSKNPWFRRREGASKDNWGFIPINWKGWIALILLIGINVFASNYFDVMNFSFVEASKFLVVFLLSISVFILVAEKKTRG